MAPYSEGGPGRTGARRHTGNAVSLGSGLQMRLPGHWGLKRPESHRVAWAGEAGRPAAGATGRSLRMETRGGLGERRLPQPHPQLPHSSCSPHGPGWGLLFKEASGLPQSPGPR